MDLKTQRAATLKAATDIVDEAKAQNRDLTLAETRIIESKSDEVKALDVKIKAAEKSSALIAGLAGAQVEPPPGGIPNWEENTQTGAKSDAFSFSKSALAKTGRTLAHGTHNAARAKGVSTILPGASLEAPIQHAGILPLGRDTQSFLELISTTLISGRHYNYARETAFTNNAKIVAPGDVKPTSTLEIELVSGQTQVIAHLSPNIDEMLLRDVEGLASSVTSSLTWGLYETIEDQAVNGTGTGELTGILNTTGVQDQAFTEDALTTIRSAITRLRTSGYEAKAIVLNYADWQALELTRTNAGEGAYLLNSGGSPIDSTKRTLWGVQVVESSAVEPGTAIILDPSAAELKVSQPGILLSWHVSGDGFEKNTTRSRAEVRADLAVTKPAAIVKATLTEG